MCLYFHNDKDRRRANFQHYNHIPCARVNCNCNKSHNKIEQLYHPSRYKSKFCQTYGKDPSTCEYRDFCSFAHTKSEIIIELYDEDNKDQNYITSYYKTIWCPYTLEYAIPYAATSEAGAATPTTSRTTAGTPRSTSTSLRTARLGTSRGRSSRSRTAGARPA